MRKALLYLGNETKHDTLIDSAIYLQNNFGFEIIPLYIKDISRDKVISSSGDGLLIGGRAPVLFNGWEEIEKENVNEIKKILKSKGINHEIIIDIGLIVEIITERMKSCDLLIMGKNEVLSEKTLGILKGNYKSILFIGEKPLASSEKIVIANDDGVKVNRSCYHFADLFPEIKNFTSITINKNLEENLLQGYMEGKGKTMSDKNLAFDNYDSVLKEVDTYDMLIMGNLSRSYFFEKIIGKNGIKLLENTKIPTFIG